MKVGRGTEDGVEVGPLIDATQRGKVAELVDDAVGRGATARSSAATRATAPATSTSRPCSPTCPTTPTCCSEEIFGPVAPVTGFDDEDEAIAAANDTEYGLVAYVYTSDLKRALRVVERLETGMVGLNQGIVSNPAAPFGGIKQSGLRPRGRPRGDRGVPRDEVRGHQSVAAGRRPRRTAQREPRALKLRRASVDTGTTKSLSGRNRARGLPLRRRGCNRAPQINSMSSRSATSMASRSSRSSWACTNARPSAHGC